MLITVIIRTYNSARSVKKAIDSVIIQTLAPDFYEILVVDDGSTDNIESILALYQNKIRFVRQEHRGPIEALNRGIKEARGDYIILLDSDDSFEPEILEKMLSALKNNKDAAFAYCDYYEKDIMTGAQKVVSLAGNIFQSVAGGIMFKKKILKEAGLYDESLIFPEYDLLMKLIKKGAKGDYISQPLFTYIRHEGSLTARRDFVRKGELQLEKKYNKKIPIRDYQTGEKMRIVFIGCKFMGYECLQYLLGAGKNIVSVYTLDPELKERTAGFQSFDDLMKNKNIAYRKISDINSKETIENIRADKPDLIIQVGWSQIIKTEVLKIAPRGMIGFHASLLPKDKGGSPVNWAIIKGKKNWGTTLFYLEPGVDSGDIIAQKKVDIDREDTVKTVYEKINKKNIEILAEYLPLLEKDEAPKIKQDESAATYTKRRKPADGIIDWNKSACDIYNWIRALTYPYPGAFSFYKNQKMYLWESKLADKNEEKSKRPGEIIKLTDEGLAVSAADNPLLITRFQIEGCEELAAKEAIEKYGIKIGDKFCNKYE